MTTYSPQRGGQLALALLSASLLFACNPSEDFSADNCQGKCDSFTDVTWLYPAESITLATCQNEESILTCRLSESPEEVRPSQVTFGSDPNFLVRFPGKVSVDEPVLRLPEYFNAGAKLAISMRPSGSWTGDVGRLVTVPASGQSLAYLLPYEVWRVQLTNVNEGERFAGFRHAVKASAEFQFVKSDTQEFQSFSMLKEKGTSSTYFIPVTSGGSARIFTDINSLFAEGAGVELTSPGCYLLKADGSVGLDTDCKETQRIVGGSEESGGPDGGVDEDEVEDVDLNNDCLGTCKSSEVCVQLECRPLQSQGEYSCNSVPDQTCDLGQDQDCMAGNVCVEGLCRRLECQGEFSCNTEPDKICESDDHCVTGNVCVEGLCRRLECQGEFSCNSAPDQVCEREEHCASGNSCVDELCRRDGC